MYEIIITKIKNTLTGISEVKEFFAYPENKYTKYPAVIFSPSDLDNSYATTNENTKDYRFTMFVIVGLNGTTKQQVFESTMPKTIDAIISQFDQDWDFGTQDGHRLRAVINTGSWGVETGQDGEIAGAQLNLSIKVLTNN